MAKREAISASTRWTVFARDGFSCRYCGASAGEDGVELAVDHVLSVAEGGDNRIENLVTACKKCNGGKGARSLKNAPTSQQVIERIDAKTRSLQEQSEAISRCINAKKDLEQQIIDLKCEAYRVKCVTIANGELAIVLKLVNEFGADRVLEWYSLAASSMVPERKAIKYVCGIARNTREQEQTVATGEAGLWDA
jgi:archaellum component FlaC